MEGKTDVQSQNFYLSCDRYVSRMCADVGVWNFPEPSGVTMYKTPSVHYPLPPLALYSHVTGFFNLRWAWGVGANTHFIGLKM